MISRRAGRRGFILLPVVLAMTLIAAIAFLINRDRGINASMVGRQSDVDRARYAAEAGLQAVNAIVQGANCAGSYPSSASPHTHADYGGASYSAYANPASGNVTSLVATGSYNGASVTLTRNNVIAYQTTPKTYTLQPDATAGLDSHIKIASAINFGTETEIQVKQSNTFPLIKFDLSAFPPGSLPLAASLSLYPGSVSGGGAVSVRRLKSSWVEGDGITGVNWATRDGSLAWTQAGGDYHSVAVASVADTVQDVWSSFDVTDLAVAWMLGRYPNHGVMLASSPSAGTIKYHGSENSSAATRPKMTVTYLVPCGMTGP